MAYRCSWVLAATAAAVWAACSSEVDAPPGAGAADSGAGADAAVILGAAGNDGADGGNPCLGDNPPDGCQLVPLKPACGDGSLDVDPCEPGVSPGAGCEEQCDDGNGLPGDGCSGRCAIEPFYACPTPGSPCELLVECGDGQRGPGELCDDGNTADGDGCSADCHSVEVGFVCTTPGAACIRLVQCGDGVVTAPEQCDDANDVNGDGCSDRCRYEPGYMCTGNPSVCAPTVCGDGQTIGGEACDDGNTFPYDGCSSDCRSEPHCTAGGACTSPCGDGLVIGEECDDGNGLNGDGCSDTCQIEPGWVCDSSGALGDQMVVPIVYRDFRQDGPCAHPNFADRPDTGSAVALTGLVQTTLDADGKPVFSGAAPPEAYMTNQADFSAWYRDDPRNIAYAETVTLLRTGSVYTSDPAWVTLFTPLDNRGWTQQTPPEQTFPAWDSVNLRFTGTSNNFLFTSELRYWFRYDATAQQTLNFSGDDDVWVFVGGRLVTDIGGIHAPVTGGFTLGPSTADVDGNPLNLVAGSVYEIALFQAERNPGGSTYSLTLSGFANAPSTCEAVCGDGAVSSGEECDDGIDDGGYNECAPGCILGPHCGDAIVQAPQEDCDDGTNAGDYGGCGADCRLGPHCGDSLVQAPMEDCDDGANDGGYGECWPGCVLGPRCGDGVVQDPYEQCDDGNNIDLDGCSATCLNEEYVQ